MSEAKVDQIGNEAASVAGAVALIPTPASPALLLFAAIEPLIFPETVHLFASLFNKIKHSKNPNTAARAAVEVAHDEVDYVNDIDPDGQGRDV